MKKIWKKNAKEVFPENFESIPDSELSSKFVLLSNMMAELFKKLDEKIILVSNYVETLDIFESVCREKRYPFIRFDGKTKICER